MFTLPDQGEHTVPPPPAELPRAASNCHHLALHGVRLHLEDVMKTQGHTEVEVTSWTEKFAGHSFA